MNVILIGVNMTDINNSGKDKCVSSTNIINTTEASDNAHEESVLFDKNYDNYDFVIATVTERTGRDNININDTLDMIKDIKLKNTNRIINGQLNTDSLQNKITFAEETVIGYVGILLIIVFQLLNFI